MKLRTILTTAAAMLLLAATAAIAQTPDWMTPAVETICDNESGAAYGLCNAYCEAMDCELANDNGPPDRAVRLAERLRQGPRQVRAAYGPGICPARCRRVHATTRT